MKSNLIKDITNWIDERTGLIKAGAEFLHEEIPGGTKFSYTLGSACMFLLTIQIITGIWQLFFYVPTVDHAYSSLNYLRLQIPFGWLIHGFHYWGANLFTIIVGLHALRVFIWGSYKKPRELVWLIGIVLIIMTALFMFTGPVLAWDKSGYWAGQVGIGIAGSVPVVGPFTELILQGASKMGQAALLRIYVLHVAVLPGAIGLFIFLHLVAFRKNGEAGPWDADKRKKVGYFWPEQIFKDVVVAFLIFLLLVFLSAFYPAPFSGLADPMDTLYTPKPAWNFLFLYQLLKFLPGQLEWVGTAGVPLIIVLLFGSLPFMDKGPDRNPFKRGFVVLGGFVFVGIILGLTWMGYVYRSPAEAAHMEPAQSIVSMKDDHRQRVIEEVNANESVTGEHLFKTLGCTECHSATGAVSNKQGPDLAMAKANNRTSQWLHDQIMAPQSHNANTIMPPYSHLSAKNVDLLVSYLEGLEVKQAPVVVAPVVVLQPGQDQGQVNIQVGEQLFNTQGCVQCHTITGHKSFKAGPDLIQAIAKDKPSKEWLKIQLTAPTQHNPLSIMPSYASRLQDTQIDALVDFLSSLSTRPVAAQSAQEAAGEQEGSTQVSKGVGPSADIIGDREHGAVLFHQSCLMCHGPHGDTKTKGFAAPKGVPSLNPIDENVYNKDAQAFVNHLDIYLQHGAPNPEGGSQNMPNFGDTNALTQAQIADLEAYILYLNGVDRTHIVNPGVDPKEFFYMLMQLTFVVVFLSGLYWWILKFIK